MLARNKNRIHNKNHKRINHALKPRFRCFICNAESHKVIDYPKNPNKRQGQKISRTNLRRPKKNRKRN